MANGKASPRPAPAEQQLVKPADVGHVLVRRVPEPPPSPEWPHSRKTPETEPAELNGGKILIISKAVGSKPVQSANRTMLEAG
jgi:hypothetical protein